MTLVCFQSMLNNSLMFASIKQRRKHRHLCFLAKARTFTYTLFAYGNMIRSDPTLVYLTSNFLVLCTNMKVYLYNYYSYWGELNMNIHLGKG